MFLTHLEVEWDVGLSEIYIKPCGHVDTGYKVQAWVNQPWSDIHLALVTGSALFNLLIIINMMTVFSDNQMKHYCGHQSTADADQHDVPINFIVPFTTLSLCFRYERYLQPTWTLYHHHGPPVGQHCPDQRRSMWSCRPGGWRWQWSRTSLRSTPSSHSHYLQWSKDQTFI